MLGSITESSVALYPCWTQFNSHQCWSTYNYSIEFIGTFISALFSSSSGATFWSLLNQNKKVIHGHWVRHKAAWMLETTSHQNHSPRALWYILGINLVILNDLQFSVTSPRHIAQLNVCRVNFLWHIKSLVAELTKGESLDIFVKKNFAGNELPVNADVNTN